MLLSDSFICVFKFEFNLERFYSMNAIVIIGYDYDIYQNNKRECEIEMSSMPKLELSYRPRILSNSNLLLSYLDDV